MSELHLIIKRVEPTLDGMSIVIFVDGTTSATNPHYCIVPLAQISFLQKLPERIFIMPVDSLPIIPNINGISRLKDYKPSKFIGFKADGYVRDVN